MIKTWGWLFLKDKNTYITLVLNKYLHAKKTYTNLTEKQAISELNKLQSKACKLFVKNTKYLTEHDLNCFCHFLLQIPTKCRVPQFYGMPKVHKNKTPQSLPNVAASQHLYPHASETGFLLSGHFLLNKIHFFLHSIIFLNAFYVFQTHLKFLNPICKIFMLINSFSVSFLHVPFT